MFYGDLSLPVMAAPSNSLPVIRGCTISVLTNHNPVQVSCSVDAYDSDGTVSNIEWFLSGYDYGRAVPTFAGTGTNVLWSCLTPGVYTNRVEVVDNYKARTWQEFVITVPTPTACTVTASAGTGGSISPSGNVVVTLGSSGSFTNTPNQWYHTNAVMVDGTNQGTPSVYTFNNITVDHTITALFSPDLVSSNTPKWWLAQINPAWTNDFNAAALGDQDGDGIPTWAEYIAGTDPTNKASTFYLGTQMNNGQAVVTFPTVVPGVSYGGINRYYTLECTTNLNAGTWTAISGWTDVLATGQPLAYTCQTASSNSFYRCKVRLGP
jgi:hypothetical protein